VSRLASYALFEGRPLTTRGQWINPFLFAHFALEKKLPQLKKVQTPISILGTGRSGTTILGVVLSMHREVGFLNEPKAMWHAIFPEEDVIGSYSRGAAHYRLAAADANDEVKKNAHKLFGAYLATVFSPRLVDKYPELIFRVPFVREIFPDAKFIFLVRNGWDTCHSIDAWSSRLGESNNSEVHDWWGRDKRKWNLLLDEIVPEYNDLALHAEDMRKWLNQTDMAAVEWIVTMREGMKLIKEYPKDVLRVDYEDLCCHPRKILTDIVSFANFEFDQTYLNFGAHTLSAAKSVKPFELHEFIKEPFIQTMKELGYR